MAELLEIYDLQSNLIGVQDRKEFYKEIKEEYDAMGTITKKVKTIRLFLMTSAGRIYLQKRSKHKSDNAGMYDKTVGGHVVAGDSFNMTVVKECAEEM
ncbi:MAG: NUDIX domain-containing protein [Candidatus Peribacteria bacterium]|jgi:isopentenyldiphosphate isomerase|nr:NUDIX domain-containing protein [Candidatus Peribacteria bacterium]